MEKTSLEHTWKHLRNKLNYAWIEGFLAFRDRRGVVKRKIPDTPIWHVNISPTKIHFVNSRSSKTSRQKRKTELKLHLVNYRIVKVINQHFTALLSSESHQSERVFISKQANSKHSFHNHQCKYDKHPFSPNLACIRNRAKSEIPERSRVPLSRISTRRRFSFRRKFSVLCFVHPTLSYSFDLGDSRRESDTSLQLPECGQAEGGKNITLIQFC